MTASAIAALYAKGVLNADPHHVEPAFAGNSIPFFLACDNNYFAHTIATIASIMRHASAAKNYDALILMEGVDPAALEAGLKWTSAFPNLSLRYLDIGQSIQRIGGKKFPVFGSYSVATYYRIFAPDVFANYDKIVYLDSDLLLLADIARLFRTEIGNSLAAASHDPVIEHQSLRDPKIQAVWENNLGLRPGDPYYNAGMLVMNLSALRRENIKEQLLSKIINTPPLAWLDQDIINSVMRGRIASIGLEWNFHDWMADPDERSNFFDDVGAENRQTIRSIRDSDGIKLLHFAGRKPWRADYFGENDHMYWRIAEETPFYEDTCSAFLREWGTAGLVAKYLTKSVQTANFFLRSVFSPISKQRQYERRLNLLKLERRRIRRLLSAKDVPGKKSANG